MRKWLIPGIVTAALLLGGAAFGYRMLKQNQPDPQWVQISMRIPPDGEQIKKLEKDSNTRLRSDEIILPVVRELDLARRWNLPGEEAAAAELRKRAFVRFNRNTQLEVGLTGKLKERETTQEVAKRLAAKFMESIKPPTRSSI